MKRDVSAVLKRTKGVKEIEKLRIVLKMLLKDYRLFPD